MSGPDLPATNPISLPPELVLHRGRGPEWVDVRVLPPVVLGSRLDVQEDHSSPTAAGPADGIWTTVGRDRERASRLRRPDSVVRRPESVPRPDPRPAIPGWTGVSSDQSGDSPGHSRVLGREEQVFHPYRDRLS